MTMHEGHRKRMRERFRREGLEGFAPHEVLELLLFYGRARGDVNGTAHALLDAFGTLQGVLEARPEQLMTVPGVGEETATLIGLMLPMFRRYTACVAEQRQKFFTRDDLMAFAVSLLSGWRSERFYVVCLDSDLRYIGHRLIAEGSLDEVSAYPRRVAEAALNMNARSVLLCHNHPGGRAEPSNADVETTLSLLRMLKGLGITLQDHVIVSGMEAYSLHAHGQLQRQITLGLRQEAGELYTEEEGFL